VFTHPETTRAVTHAAKNPKAFIFISPYGCPDERVGVKAWTDRKRPKATAEFFLVAVVDEAEDKEHDAKTHETEDAVDGFEFPDIEENHAPESQPKKRQTSQR